MPIGDLPPPQTRVQPKQQEVRAAEPDVVNRPSILKDVGAAMAGNFDPLTDTLAGKWKQFQGSMNPPLTDNQEKAAKYIHAMLEPGRLGGEDRTFNHRDAEAVGKGITDRTVEGFAARMGIGEKRIRDGLTEAGVVEDKDAAPDATKRRVSLKSLDNLQKAQTILGQRSQFLEKLNLRVEFPGGISQDAMQHLLDNKPGIPPGGRLAPLKK